jgi:hypothetical protein
METSARTSNGVDDAFECLIKQALVNEGESKLNLPEHIRLTKDQKESTKEKGKKKKKK